jgi:hypothetical protein
MLAFGQSVPAWCPTSEVVLIRIDAYGPGIDAFLDEGDSAGSDPFEGGLLWSGFDALFIIVPILIVGGFVLMVILAVVNARRLKRKGINPLATEAEIMADAMRGPSAQRPGAQPAVATAKTLEARLEELENLHAAGKITAAERDAARASVLGTL